MNKSEEGIQSNRENGQKKEHKYDLILQNNPMILAEAWKTAKTKYCQRYRAQKVLVRAKVI